MTPIYALLIFSASCPFTLKWLPPKLQPLICERKQEIEEYRSAAKAMERVKELGPEATFAILEADSPIILREVEWEPTVGDAK